MAVSMKQMSMIVAACGVLSFIFGVVAENKKPAQGIAIKGKDTVTCKYPSDPTVVLGYLSVVFLVSSAVAAYFSLFYPYRGKSVPRSTFFQSTTLVVFFNISIVSTGLAAVLLLWPTITEQLHLTRNVHYNLETSCPTAKTGVLGGGAFISLNASLFWLVSLMLADNVREDHFEEFEGTSGKKDHGSVLATDYDSRMVKGVA